MENLRYLLLFFERIFQDSHCAVILKNNENEEKEPLSNFVDFV